MHGPHHSRMLALHAHPCTRMKCVDDISSTLTSDAHYVRLHRRENTHTKSIRERAGIEYAVIKGTLEPKHFSVHHHGAAVARHTIASTCAQGTDASHRSTQKPAPAKLGPRPSKLGPWILHLRAEWRRLKIIFEGCISSTTLPSTDIFRLNVRFQRLEGCITSTILWD